MAAEDRYQPNPAIRRLLNPRVGVCCVAGPFMHSRTAFCLQCQAVHSASVGIKELPLSQEGFDPAAGRNAGARVLLEHGAEWILFVDSDMQFPPSALAQLLQHDVDIVGADYRYRGTPFKRMGGYDKATMPQSDTGLVEREFLGLGLFLVKAPVFAKVGQPWFARIYDNPNPDEIMTEDLWFCGRARAAGYTVWCDMDLTKDVSHLGVNYVTWDIPDGKRPPEDS
jgi:glycosyltransferase involved in cell wall biosynthesis